MRFIVGSGIIREEAIMSLEGLERQKIIISQRFEPGNNGAILVKLKH
jgi:hypothetical protein